MTKSKNNIEILLKSVFTSVCSFIYTVLIMLLCIAITKQHVYAVQVHSIKVN